MHYDNERERRAACPQAIVEDAAVRPGLGLTSRAQRDGHRWA
jgi:hypothetical protein